MGKVKLGIKNKKKKNSQKNEQRHRRSYR